MKEELINVLNHEKIQPKGHHGSSNSQNGYYSLNYDIKYGTIEGIQIIGDYYNELEQQLIPAFTRRDDLVVQYISSWVLTGMAIVKYKISLSV